MHVCVVIPFHNESGNIKALFEALVPVLDSEFDSHRIICVDDGSKDDTYSQLKVAKAGYPELHLVKLSRNFGKDNALSAGLRQAHGDAVLIMDADLQHPPSVIPELVAALKQGVDIAYGVRRSRDTDGPLRRYLSRSFYNLFSSISDVKIPANAGDFRLLSRRAYEALNALPENNRFMKGLYAWIGFSTMAVEFDVPERHSGTSQWSLRRLSRYAWDGIVSFSSAPLRVSAWVGTFIAVVSAAYAFYVFVTTLVFGRDLPGFATLATAVFFLGGLQLLSIGILGEYQARIFDETKRRPSYIIEQTDDD